MAPISIDALSAAPVPVTKANAARRTPSTQDVSHLLRVERGPEGSFLSKAVSLVSLPAGAVFARIETATPATVAYSSVQVSPTEHIELNSDLVFINHSCDPVLEFDMEAMEVRVSRDRPLTKGQDLSFFYPSTEWNMSQPFQCHCNASQCKGWIAGAKDMNESELRNEYWLNKHIVQMLDARSN